MGSLNGLLKRCEAEIDYIEKVSNKDLDSKTGNKGLANYTKYARDINKLGLMGCQGQPWCATYQFWLEVQEFGLEQALKNWNMTKDSYVGYNCFSTYNKFKAAGKISKTPQVGALVIFTTSHMGRVIKVSGNKFWTNEGNTSSKAYERNGGMVAMKSYYTNDSKIKGFCIIDYNKCSSPIRSYLMRGDEGSAVKELQKNLIAAGYSCGTADGDFGTKTEDALKKFQKDYGLTVDGLYGAKTKAKLVAIVKEKQEEKEKEQAYIIFVKAVQKALGAKVDGKAGSETLSKTITVSRFKNNKHAVVKPIQTYLKALGYNVGRIDGHAGIMFQTAVIAFQKDHGCVKDGEVTAKGKTWKKLLKLV